MATTGKLATRTCSICDRAVKTRGMPDGWYRFRSRHLTCDICLPLYIETYTCYWCGAQATGPEHPSDWRYRLGRYACGDTMCRQALKVHATAFLAEDRKAERKGDEMANAYDPADYAFPRQIDRYIKYKLDAEIHYR